MDLKYIQHLTASEQIHYGEKPQKCLKRPKKALLGFFKVSQLKVYLFSLKFAKWGSKPHLDH